MHDRDGRESRRTFLARSAGLLAVPALAAGVKLGPAKTIFRAENRAVGPGEFPALSRADTIVLVGCAVTLPANLDLTGKAFRIDRCYIVAPAWITFGHEPAGADRVRWFCSNFITDGTRSDWPPHPAFGLDAPRFHAADRLARGRFTGRAV